LLLPFPRRIRTFYRLFVEDKDSMPFSCDAIVLRRTRFSETSLVVVALSREAGRVEALARGCRRERSPLRGHLDLFNREEMLLYERSRTGLDLLAESAICEEFMALRTRAEAFAVASLGAEILLAACMPRDPHPRAFDILVESLRALDRGEPADVTACALVLGLLTDLGFAPRLDACAACALPLPERTPLFLSGARGGLVCPDCEMPGAAEPPRRNGRPKVETAALRPLAPGVVAALHYLARQTQQKAGRLALSSAAALELFRALLGYAQYVLGRPLKSAPVAARLMLRSRRRRRQRRGEGTIRRRDKQL
jgi:DNA repair protein RecO (recombination protein O)